ncbi:MAG TPA: ATPase, T2SS/T4P/T4SS family [Rhodopila sp.]|uniref:GspE/PulE family protein n=1 Tax=Rhodopila sp. TaxID=2480087 RepID=UPI002CF8E690|nr:ATPase, T2SS/T4P/T4SS family [Rhodopila sp.]HVY16316.1 ATPase, T2SS/T4P/T4SS family [Rhodopila sp.]
MARIPREDDDNLANVLVAFGHCDRRMIDRAFAVAEESGQRFDVVLIRLGLVTESGLADAYSRVLGIPIATPARYPQDQPLLAQRLGAPFVRRNRVIPVAEDATTVTLAMVDPMDSFVTSAVALATGRQVCQEVAVPIELEAALNRLYPNEEEVEEGEASETVAEDDAERLRDLASEAPVIRLVNQMITRAVETKASDIHIEPFEDRVRVRYRYDGVLYEAEAPPPHLVAAVISRVKIMARLDIAERRMPQDGRIRLPVRGQDIDLRVSTIPSLHGETVVMRVLDRSAVTLTYSALGLSDRVVEGFRAALDLPNGIVLVTGPTGSGKTTTLYTGLTTMNAVSRKIVTVEDPIEYQLRGINQIQVRSHIGLTFASLLRSILRQDPDVIMVGEIRDQETAQIAVQAALTGHLVLSTLHTNSAATAVTRLRDMGVEDYLLTAVLRGVLAQRLVRRLCTECREPAPAPPELVRRFDLEERWGSAPRILFRPVGCAACRQTGYRGRLAIAEFLQLTPELERLILNGGDHASIEQMAMANGMQSMFESGLDAVLEGETTLEEMARTIRADG